MIRSSVRFSLAALVAILSFGPSPAPAQQGSTLRGRVIDAETGDPISYATAQVKDGKRAATDSTGRFVITGLPAGTSEVTIQAMGYETKRWKLDLAADQTVERTFSLEFTGEKLPEVVVTARAEKLMPRYVDFERRRERGLGAYLRWDEIKKKNFNTVGEAARSVRGVRMDCVQADFECYVRMARTPNCRPQWWVDGVNVSSFHESTPIRDIYGIEIYRGPGEVPGEFSGSNAGCGVIVLWTKSKPYR
jgi:hypothetical protein